MSTQKFAWLVAVIFTVTELAVLALVLWLSATL